MMTAQMEMVLLSDLVPKDHNYRKFKEVFNFKKIDYRLKKMESDTGCKGYGMARLFKCLLYQFMEDLSDRQLEAALQSNNIAKWFCGFNLLEKTPDHSLFGEVRKRIGTNKLSKLFQIMKSQLKAQGFMSEVFTFVDSAHLISKAQLWEERDKIIKQKYDKLNNVILPKVASDKQARIGCKGKGKFWYGFKTHRSVDMQSGMINKIAVTAANVNDANALQHICPKQGAVFGDKGYCTLPAQIAAAKNAVHLAAVKVNNMKTKNRDLDKWYSKMRAPYERVFSQRNKRVRYKGVAKNQFAEFLNAMCFNLKRLITIARPPVALQG
jgi:IS5 family transposase